MDIYNLGSLCALAPARTKDVGPMAVRALIAATLACLMTGGVAERSSQKDRFYWEDRNVREVSRRLQ